ncbi:MAG: hypothetical protein ACFFAS_16360 [Promethearchaeota archaeon]
MKCSRKSLIKGNLTIRFQKKNYFFIRFINQACVYTEIISITPLNINSIDVENISEEPKISGYWMVLPIIFDDLDANDRESFMSEP